LLFKAYFNKYVYYSEDGLAYQRELT
jgi:hypothetical protein